MSLLNLLSIWPSKSKPKTRRVHRKRACFAFESLERRELLAATQGTLQVGAGHEYTHLL